MALPRGDDAERLRLAEPQLGDAAAAREAADQRLEPVELDEEGRLYLWDVIEDELLLNLPDFPMHPQDECQALKIEPQEDIAAEEPQRSNPFDVLAQLKQK